MPRPSPLIPVRVGTNRTVHLGMIAGRDAAKPRYETACMGSRGPSASALAASSINCRNCLRGNGLVISLAHANAGIAT